MPPRRPPAPVPTARPRLARGLMAATLALVLFMLATALLARPLHERLAAEDGFVEWVTFVGLALAAGVLLSRWWRFRAGRPVAWQAVMLLGGLAAVFGAGEEISWGQRVFGWATSETFAANRQGETNLHNLEVGGLNINKVVFTYGLGLGLAVYFLALPFLTARRPALANWLTRLGIPVGSRLIAGWFVLCVLVVLLIPYSRKWETLEVLVPLGALAVLWERGVVGEGLTPGPTFGP